MIRWKVAQLIERKGWNPHRLAREVGLTPPVAYRLARTDAKVQRVDALTLAALCRAFDCQPGALLEYRPTRGESAAQRVGSRKTAGRKRGSGAKRGSAKRGGAARKRGAARKSATTRGRGRGR